MANTQGRSITYAGRKVISADPMQYPAAAGLANSYTCPLGPATGVGYVLMLQSDVTLLGDGSNSASLIFQTSRENPAKVEISELFVERATRVAGGSQKDDPNAVQLVKLVDKRYHLNRWSSTKTDARYNLRNWSGGDPDRSYVRETVKSAQTPLTWNEIVKELWDSTGQLGTYVDVAAFNEITPPEDVYLLGMNSWRALNELIVKIGYTVLYNPLEATFSIIQLRGAGDSIDLNIGAPPVLYDVNAFNGGACVAPEKIRINFPLKYEDHGYQRDSQATENWVSSVSGFQVEKSTNAPGAVPGTVLDLWDSTPAMKLHGTDHDATTLQNQSAIDNIATKRLDSWLRSRGAESGARKYIVYSGVFSVRPASNIRRVVWRDYGPIDGMVTEILDYPGLDAGVEAIRIGLTGDVSPESYDSGEKANELFQPQDFGRHTWPSYPSLIQLVKVTEGKPVTDAEGVPIAGSDEITPLEGNNIFGGSVFKFNPATKDTEAIESCWIFVESKDDIQLSQGSFLVGRLSGLYVGEGDFRLPIYLCNLATGSGRSNVKWGSVLFDVTDWQADCTVVGVAEVASCNDTPVLGGNLDVVNLPEISGVNPNLHAGDVIAYTAIEGGGTGDAEAEPSEGFVIVSDYTSGGGVSVVVTLNADLGDWGDTEGCTTASGDIVACSGSLGSIGETIDIIFPNVIGRVPFLKSGDRCSASPTDVSATPKKYLITSDYSESEGSEAVVVTLNGDVPQWSAVGCVTASGDIVECSGSGGEVGETVDIIFPNVLNRLSILKSGDRCSAVPTDLEADPKKYVVTSDYTEGPQSVVVSLNGDVAQWPDTAGCTTASGDIVACSGSGGEIGETVDVIFPNVPQKFVAASGGDNVAASPSDLTSSPKKYVASSDYSVAIGSRPFTLTSSLGGGSASVTFNDDGSSGTVVDRFGLYDYGQSGDVGYAAWVVLAGQYEIHDFKCDDGLGGS